MINEGDLGWVAGILDLKGKVYRLTARQGGRIQYSLCVTDRNVPLIRQLCHLTGVRGQDHDGGRERAPEHWRRACDLHCPQEHVHVKPPGSTLRWGLRGAGALIVIDAVLPFCRIQRDAFAEVRPEIASQINAQINPGKSGIATRRMADMGWAIPEELEGYLS